MRRFLCAFLMVCSPVVAQDAMFRGNPQHTGVYSGPGISKFTKVRWQFQTKVGFVIACDRWRHYLYREQRPPALRARSRHRHQEMDLQDREPHHIFSGRRGRYRLLRKLRRELLRRRCYDWQGEMEVRDAWRTTFCRNAPPWCVASSGGHARSLRFLPFLAGGREWNGLFRQRRHQCLCAGCCDRPTKVEVQDRRRGARIAGNFRWGLVCRQLGFLLLRA